MLYQLEHLAKHHITLRDERIECRSSVGRMMSSYKSRWNEAQQKVEKRNKITQFVLSIFREVVVVKINLQIGICKPLIKFLVCISYLNFHFLFKKYKKRTKSCDKIVINK